MLISGNVICFYHEEHEVLEEFAALTSCVFYRDDFIKQNFLVLALINTIVNLVLFKKHNFCIYKNQLVTRLKWVKKALLFILAKVLLIALQQSKLEILIRQIFFFIIFMSFMVINSFSRPTIALALLLLSQAHWAATLLVAVASNFSKPMTEIASSLPTDTLSRLDMPQAQDRFVTQCSTVR